MSSFFSQSGSGITVSWQLRNVRTMRLSWPGGERNIQGTAGNEENGSYTITKRGEYELSYQITFHDNRQQGTAIISVDGSEIINYQNLTITRHSKKVPCRGEDQIESTSRGSCPTGYSKQSKQQYRIWSVNSNKQSNLPTVPQFTGGWLDGTGPVSIPTRGFRTDFRGNRYYRSARQVRTFYYCQKDPNCTETIQVEDHNFVLNRHGSLGTYRNGESAAEEAARLDRERTAREEAARREAARKAEEAARKAKEEADRAAREEAARRAAIEAAAETARRTAKTYHDQLLTTFGGSKQIRDIPASNTGYTKYRVITPVQYVRDGSKLVPRVRFESVRELSPEAVSSLVHRGYEVQAVDPNTPLSSSKAYGPSVINHAQAAIDQKQIVGSSEINERRAAIMRAQQNRSGYRRVIR